MTTKHCGKSLRACIALFALLGGAVTAQDIGTLDQERLIEAPDTYSPYVDRHFPQRVLWGVAHCLTSAPIGQI